MLSHLKWHSIEWAQYTDSKILKAVPTQSQIQGPIQKEVPSKQVEAEDKAWTYFEADETDPTGLLCQVGECPYKLTKDESDPWSLHAIKDHLYTHGYKG